MAEFEAITIETQEQYDELIKERLTRHEKQIREEVTQKFADYDTVKASAAKYDEDKAAWEGEKGKLTGELNEKTKSLKVFEVLPARAGMILVIAVFSAGGEGALRVSGG
jgi:hypothetical protein